MTLATILAIGISFMAADAPKDAPKDLRAKAEIARTADEHRDVARDFEARAREFEEKARKHEAEADRIAKRQGYNPMKSKWPAHAQGPENWERGKAAQARRAARESLEMVARHRDLAEKAVNVED